ncbi:MAG: PEGA domain-containing protein [bacterium]
MVRCDRAIYLTAILLCFSVQGEAAFSSPARTDGQFTTIQITSTPSEAKVCLKGEYTVIGQTPLITSRLLAGTYKVTVSKRRFESFQSTRTFLADQSYQLSASLNPRTTLKAAGRSFLFPGWGQFYSEKKTRGFVFASTEILLASAWLLTQLSYESAQDDYEDYEKRYEKASFTKEKEILYNRMLDKLDDAEDWDRWRDRFLWAAASFWAYNVLDAVLFFPRNGGEPVQEMARTGEFGFSPGSIMGHPGVRLKIAF